ncbi:MAG: NAD(P)/FAD-dependent oxidoreductase [Prochlorotrichaceae cyanobacterium]|jgi:flavin-dependent dehydrogenase
MTYSKMTYDVIIIGAGLAGCSTAIQLAQRGHQVLLLEQQRYPTHKLCGEFLSVEVLATFDFLGISEAVEKAGAVPIHRSLVTTTTGQSFASSLPGVALGLSRYHLDLSLLQRAAAVGVTCQEGALVTGVTGTLDQGFTVTTPQDHFTARMVIGAYGKRSRLDRTLQRPFLQRSAPFVAFKGHYRGVEFPASVELHAFPGGYCGLSPIEEGQVNICWIAHKDALSSPTQDDSAPQTSPVTHPILYQNPRLADRLNTLSSVRGSTQALTQITFALKEKFHHDIWMLGDTAGMIAPLCGDGMAMALRSSELAVPLAHAFLQNELRTVTLKERYTRQWNQEFKTRLSLGRLMHYGLINPHLAKVGVALCQYIPPIGTALIRATRGTAYSQITRFNLLADLSFIPTIAFKNDRTQGSWDD